MSARTSVGLDAEDRHLVALEVGPQPVGVGEVGRTLVEAHGGAVASVPTISHGPMIQPKSANQKRRSPGRQSNWNATSSAIFTVNPPWTCTAPLGRPVVPDV